MYTKLTIKQEKRTSMRSGTETNHLEITTAMFHSRKDDPGSWDQFSLVTVLLPSTASVFLSLQWLHYTKRWAMKSSSSQALAPNPLRPFCGKVVLTSPSSGMKMAWINTVSLKVRSAGVWCPWHQIWAPLIVVINECLWCFVRHVLGF